MGIYKNLGGLLIGQPRCLREENLDGSHTEAIEIITRRRKNAEPEVTHNDRANRSPAASLKRNSIFYHGAH